MRIHCLENVDKALQFLKEQKVHLENMGSHDIVDGNHRLTLGLIWTIILRFQVCQKSQRFSKPLWFGKFYFGTSDVSNRVKVKIYPSMLSHFSNF